MMIYAFGGDNKNGDITMDKAKDERNKRKKIKSGNPATTNKNQMS